MMIDSMLKLFFIPVLFFLLNLPLASDEIKINELMAKNAFSLYNNDYNNYD